MIPMTWGLRPRLHDVASSRLVFYNTNDEYVRHVRIGHASRNQINFSSITQRGLRFSAKRVENDHRFPILGDLPIFVRVACRRGQISARLKVVSLLVTSQGDKVLRAREFEAVGRVTTTVELVSQCGQRADGLVVLTVAKKTRSKCQNMMILIFAVGVIM